MKFYGKSQQVAERILEAFQQPEALPQALAPVFIRRKDGAPCRNWSWHNQLLVALSGTMDARGFRQWQQAGRKVRKGSKALWILGPCRKKVSRKNEQGEDEERTILFGFRAIPVFAIEDTEGESMTNTSDPYARWLEELPLLEVTKQWDINVGAYSHRQGNPLGYYRYTQSGDQAIMLGTENLRARIAHERSGLAVYLDVSGSVTEHLPRIIALLRRFQDALQSVFLFSNEVVEAPFHQVVRGRIKSTFGTDFDCVAQSILDRKLDKAVVITDGHAYLKDELTEALQAKRVRILTILFGGKTDCPELEPFGDVIQLDEVFK